MRQQTPEDDQAKLTITRNHRVIPAGFFNALGNLTKNAIILNCTIPETRGTGTFDVKHSNGLAWIR